MPVWPDISILPDVTIIVVCTLKGAFDFARFVRSMYFLRKLCLIEIDVDGVCVHSVCISVYLVFYILDIYPVDIKELIFHD